MGSRQQYTTVEMRTAARVTWQRFHGNGTERVLRYAADIEAGNTGHSTVLGVGVVAESGAYRLAWISCNLSVIGWRGRGKLQFSSFSFTFYI